MRVRNSLRDNDDRRSRLTALFRFPCLLGVEEAAKNAALHSAGDNRGKAEASKKSATRGSQSRVTPESFVSHEVVRRATVAFVPRYRPALVSVPRFFPVSRARGSRPRLRLTKSRLIRSYHENAAPNIHIQGKNVSRFLFLPPPSPSALVCATNFFSRGEMQIRGISPSRSSRHIRASLDRFLVHPGRAKAKEPFAGVTTFERLVKRPRDGAAFVSGS